MMDAMSTLFLARYGWKWIYQVLLNNYTGSYILFDDIETIFKAEIQKKEDAEPIGHKLPPGHYFKYCSEINAAIIQHFHPEIKHNEAIMIGGKIYMDIAGNPGFYKVDDDMRIFIETAIKSGYTFCLVANQEKESIQKLLDYFKVADLFKYIVVSDEAGYRKPDPRFFIHAIKILWKPRPKKIAFLSNKLIDDIEGAEKAGIDHRFLFCSQNEYNGIFANTSYTKLQKVSDLLKILAEKWGE